MTYNAIGPILILFGIHLLSIWLFPMQTNIVIGFICIILGILVISI